MAPGSDRARTKRPSEIPGGRGSCRAGRGPARREARPPGAAAPPGGSPSRGRGSPGGSPSRGPARAWASSVSSRSRVAGEAITREIPRSHRARTIAASPLRAWVRASDRAGLPVVSATIVRNSGTRMPRGRSMSKVSAPVRPSRSSPSRIARRTRPRRRRGRSPRDAAANRWMPSWRSPRPSRTTPGSGGGSDLVGKFADLRAISPSILGRRERGDEPLALGQAFETGRGT